MLYSPNLHIIIKALDKISTRLIRDVGEIENLQNNHLSVTKFSASCYLRIKQSLKQELGKLRPSYNMEFADGEKLVSDQLAEYGYLVEPLDSILNLARGRVYFSTVIALEHINSQRASEIIGCVVSNPLNRQIYFAEKGKGAFLNNRRIRVSKREIKDEVLCAASNQKVLKKVLEKPFWPSSKPVNFSLSNCLSLDLAELASGSLDLVVLEKQDELIFKMLSVIFKEAGAMVVEKDGLIWVSNGKIL